VCHSLDWLVSGVWFCCCFLFALVWQADSGTDAKSRNKRQEEACAIGLASVYFSLGTGLSREKSVCLSWTSRVQFQLPCAIGLASV
jgi:hypothetical protein